jgi:glycosyltransferase involved in cell wall biosynthesis
MVTFFHDHIFLKYKNEYYTSGSLNKSVMNRYIEPFGKIKLVTRCKEVDAITGGIEPSSIYNTEFVEVPNYKKITKLFNYIKARRKIKQEVANAEYIIVRTSSFANIAAKYAQKYNKPYLVEVVGCAWDASWNYSVLGKIIAPFSYLMQKKTVRNAAYAVYVTNEYLQNKYPNNRNTTNCSNVALTQFSKDTLGKRTKRIKTIEDKDRIIIGTTAAVDVRYKGQQYVIRAISELKKRGITKYEYQLVGGGDQSYLKSLAEKYDVKDQVKFLGSLPHDKVFEWLDTIDIYSQPSRQEGLPRALIEAMSRGLPAFGAKTAGIPELLDDDFIFSNTSNNIQEICQILLSFSSQVMLEQANKNYSEAQKYDKGLIETRRNAFFKKFIDNIKEG